MQISFIGLIICAAILLAGHYYRSPFILGLMASLAFGSTALMTLTSLGGSSPLIYTVFAALLVTATAARRRIWQDLGDVFGKMRPVWIVLSLLLYAAVGAWLFPRLFTGQTSVFVQSKTRQGVVEASLAPVSANISQTGYFILGGLTAIALCVLLLHNEDRINQIRRAFFVWCSLHAGMGLIDLLSKLGGAGDVLAITRTANYAMLTEAEQSGFVRIAGAYSEASAFGGISLACLSFCYVYWRKTGSRLARALSALVLVLLLLSTSSTAYVGLAVLSVPVAFSVTHSVLARRITTDEILIVTLLVLGVFLVLAVSLYDRGIFDPVIHLVDSMIINKSSSESGQERAYWNIKSIQSFFDTNGLGVGFGSSRASSWPIAVASQLGVVGGLMMAMLVAVVFRGLGRLSPYVDHETNAVVSALRAAALAGLVAGSLVSGSADPGMVFFITLAVITASRVRARRNRYAFLLQEQRRNQRSRVDDGALPERAVRLFGAAR
jgi:hypothetical protein